jgi:hypothetical protein
MRRPPAVTGRSGTPDRRQTLAGYLVCRPLGDGTPIVEKQPDDEALGRGPLPGRHTQTVGQNRSSRCIRPLAGRATTVGGLNAGNQAGQEQTPYLTSPMTLQPGQRHVRGLKIIVAAVRRDQHLADNQDQPIEVSTLSAEPRPPSGRS